MKFDDFKNTKNYKDYINFLKKNQDVYYTNDFPWINYEGLLQPAIHLPYEPPNFSSHKTKNILKQSHLPLARWSNKFKNEKTKWWWVVLSSPIKIDQLSSNTRSKIKRGLKNCEVRVISGKWLSENGYHCYKNAFKRYKNHCYQSKKIWQKKILLEDECRVFDFWGIFHKRMLIGYNENINIANNLFTNDFKFDPNYLKLYPAYALIYSLSNHYLQTKKYNLITNGTKSIAHETQMQTFLEKFNFEKQYCQLNIVYSPTFNILVKIAYPLRKFFARTNDYFANKFLQNIKAILEQEKIRKSFGK